MSIQSFVLKKMCFYIFVWLSCEFRFVGETNLIVVLGLVVPVEQMVVKVGQLVV